LRRLNELILYRSAEVVVEILQLHPNADDWLLLRAKSKDMVVLIDLNNLEHPVVVDLKPW